VSYEVNELISGWVPSRHKVIRDFDGTVWLYVVDYTGTDHIEEWKSLDEGRNFTYHSDVTGTAASEFQPMIDEENRRYLCIGRKNCDTLPYFLVYIEGTGWTQTAGFATSTYLDSDFAIDTSRRPKPLLGFNHVAMVARKFVSGQDNIYYFDLEHPGSTIRVNAQVGSQLHPRICVSADGFTFISWRFNSEVYIAQQASWWPSTPTFTPPYLCSKAGHTVIENCDVAINPLTTLPGVLYRRNNGGIHELWLAEVLPDGLTWVRTQVWDGTNNSHHYPGYQQLAYDRRGSVMVSTYCDVPGGTPGVGEPYLFTKFRAIDPTWDWSLLRISGATSGGTVSAGNIAIPYDTGCDVAGLKPTLFEQGALCYAWIQPPAGAPAASSLFYVNRDEWPGDSFYPVRWSACKGTPLFKSVVDEVDEGQQMSWPLAGESTTVSDYPQIPDAVFTLKTTRQIANKRYALGHKGGYPVFMNARREIRVVQKALNTADKDACITFLRARAKDKEPMNVQTKRDGTLLKCFMTAEFLEEIFEEQIGPTAFRFEFSALESF
jgi:hypothetical protein